MIIKTLANALIISVIATGTLSLTYDVKDKIILAIINVIIFIGIAIIENINIMKIKEEKNNSKKQNLETLKIIVDDNTKTRMEIIKGNEIISHIITYYKEIKNEIKVSSVEHQNTIDKLKETLVEELRDNSVKIVKGLNDCNNSIDIVSNRLGNTIDLVRDNHSNILKSNNEIIEGSKIRAIVNQENINIFREAIVKQLEEMSEHIIENMVESKEYIDCTTSELKKIKNLINDKSSDMIDGNKEIVSQYKGIQGEIFKEINILTDKNKSTAELLKSNYKVLNILIEKYS